MSSRWATSNDEDAKVHADRKLRKEEKRRLKEEKQRIADTENAKSEQEVVTCQKGAERPSKRQRTRSPGQEDSSLAQFPTLNFSSSRSVDLYEILNNIEEGSYGFVSRARTKSSGEVVALKRLKVQHANEGFPVTGLREIQTLRACSHRYIVNLREVVVGSKPAQE